MSVLPFNFDITLAAFAHPHPITVRDTGLGEYVGGRWVPGEETTRQIRATVLQMKPEELELLMPGHASNGGIALHTKAELYFSDLKGKGDTQETRQSYVEYQGYTFRVFGTGFMFGNTNLNIYNAVRYDER